MDFLLLPSFFKEFKQIYFGHLRLQNRLQDFSTSTVKMDFLSHLIGFLMAICLIRRAVGEEGESRAARVLRSSRCRRRTGCMVAWFCTPRTISGLSMLLISPCPVLYCARVKSTRTIQRELRLQQAGRL